MWDPESDVWLADLTDSVGRDRGGDVTHMYPRNNEICKFRIWLLVCESWRWCVLWRSDMCAVGARHVSRKWHGAGRSEQQGVVGRTQAALAEPTVPVNVLISWANPLTPVWSKMGYVQGLQEQWEVVWLTEGRDWCCGWSMENCLLCSQLTVNVAQKRGHCGRYWLFRSLRHEEG